MKTNRIKNKKQKQEQQEQQVQEQEDKDEQILYEERKEEVEEGSQMTR